MVRIPQVAAVVPRTRRSRWIAGMIAFAVLYVGLLTAYAVGGGAAIAVPDKLLPDGGVAVLITTRDFSASGALMEADVQILLDSSLLAADSDGPARQIAVSLNPTEQDADLVYPAGRRPDIRQVRILFDGDIQAWPFDHYATSLTAQAWSGANGLDELPTVLAVDGAVQGWHLAGGPDTGSPEFTTVTTHRTVGIIGLGLLLVAVMIALAVLGLTVVIGAFRGRRKMEPSFLSWIAAMLFATIPIRNFLPGNPPPGSWVDIAVVLWVIVALGAALAFGVSAWWRHTAPPG